MFGLPAAHRQVLSQLWGPTATATLSYSSLQQALAAVMAKLVDSDPTREELLTDVAHLQEALGESQVLEQAKGVLMATYGITAGAALELLRCYARAHDLTLRVVVSRVTAVVHRRPASEQMDALLGDITRAVDRQPGRTRGHLCP